MTKNTLKKQIIFGLSIVMILGLLININAATCSTCFTPDSLGSSSKVSVGIGASPAHLQDVLASAGYNVNVANDQKNIQVWKSNQNVNLEVTYLSRGWSKADHTFGYYINGNTNSFVGLFTTNQVIEGTKYTISVPANTNVSFGVKGKFWYSNSLVEMYTENSKNNGMQRAVVFDLCDTYLIGFEDLSDSSYNDVVVSIKRTNSCSSIRCSSNQECGIDGLIGSNFCQGNGVYKNYNTFICSNPGTTSSSCSNSIASRLVSSCLSGQVCSSGNCIITQCSNGIDDDNDGLMDSLDSGCWNNINDASSYNPLLNNESKSTITCFSNAQCGIDGLNGNRFCEGNNVYQNYRTYSCSNAGLGTSSCSLTTSKRPIQVCSACSNGACSQIACNSNTDCNDNNVNTIDTCLNPGTTSSSCSNTGINCVNDNDCGMTGFFGTELCSNNDVFKNFRTSKCMNPGTANSYCNVSVASRFLIDCGENTCEAYGNGYCKNNNFYHSRTCNDKGCILGSCSSTFRIEETLISTCLNGCQDNVCNNPQPTIPSNPQCVADADCSADSYTNKRCSNKSVVEDFTDYSCVNSVCVQNTSVRVKEECDKRCYNGRCKGETNSNDLDGDGVIDEETETSPLVILNNDRSDKSKVFGATGDGINETALKLQSNYAIESSMSLWKLLGIGLIIFLLIVLLVILIILIGRR